MYVLFKENIELKIKMMNCALYSTRNGNTWTIHKWNCYYLRRKFFSSLPRQDKECSFFYPGILDRISTNIVFNKTSVVCRCHDGMNASQLLSKLERTTVIFTVGKACVEFFIRHFSNTDF